MNTLLNNTHKNLQVDLNKMFSLNLSGVVLTASLQEASALRYIYNDIHQAAGLELANATSSEGKLAIYLMYFALLSYLEGKTKGKIDTKPVISALESAFSRLPIAQLRSKGCPKEILRASTKVEYLRDHLPKLREYNRSVRQDTSVPKHERDLLTLAIRAAKPDVSESTIKSLEKVAWLISADLGSKLLELVHPGSKNTNMGDNIAVSRNGDAITSVYATLKSLVKQMGGSGLTLSAELTTAARKSDKLSKIYKEYTNVRKSAKEAFEISLKALITANAGKPVDVVTAEKLMTKKGFELLFMPTASMGFVGKVGLYNGVISLFTIGDRLIAGSVPPGSKVTMNPKYDDEQDNAYIMTVTAPNAVTKGNRIYSGKYKNTSNTEKFTKAESLSRIIPKLLGTWFRDSKDKEPKRLMHSTAALMLYLTGARVGSNSSGMSSKKGVEGFGILNLRVSHVKVTTTNIILQYPGKKGMPQKHVIPLKDNVRKQLAKNIKLMIDGKHKSDMVFSLPSVTGRTEVSINFNTFSAYLKSNGFTQGAHKMRHVRGNELTEKLIAKYAFKLPKDATTLVKKQAAADKYMKETILSKVADLLGHKSAVAGGGFKAAWRTSITSYVNPKLVTNWYAERKLDVPKWIPKKFDV
jgi:integrase